MESPIWQAVPCAYMQPWEVIRALQEVEPFLDWVLGMNQTAVSASDSVLCWCKYEIAPGLLKQLLQVYNKIIYQNLACCTSEKMDGPQQQHDLKKKVQTAADKANGYIT